MRITSIHSLIPCKLNILLNMTFPHTYKILDDINWMLYSSVCAWLKRNRNNNLMIYFLQRLAYFYIVFVLQFLLFMSWNAILSIASSYPSKLVFFHIIYSQKIVWGKMSEIKLVELMLISLTEIINIFLEFCFKYFLIRINVSQYYEPHLLC